MALLSTQYNAKDGLDMAVPEYEYRTEQCVYRQRKLATWDNRTGTRITRQEGGRGQKEPSIHNPTKVSAAAEYSSLSFLPVICNITIFPYRLHSVAVYHRPLITADTPKAGDQCPPHRRPIAEFLLG